MLNKKFAVTLSKKKIKRKRITTFEVPMLNDLGHLSVRALCKRLCVSRKKEEKKTRNK